MALLVKDNHNRCYFVDMAHPNITSKPPYPKEPTNGNGKRPAGKRKQLATSVTFGPDFVTNLDGSTIITTGIATKQYYRLARTNPEVRTGIDTLKKATFWTQGHVQPQNDYEKHPEFRELDEIILDLIDQQLMALKNFHQFLQDMFVFAVRCGFAVAEKIWEPIDGTWTLTALKIRRPWDFEPVVDTFGDLAALFYYPTGEYFDPRAFVYVPWPSEGASNWLGEPILESLIHDVELGQKTEQALAKNTHLMSRRTMIHYFDALTRDKDEIDLAKRAVAEIDQGRMPQFPCGVDENGKLVRKDELEIMQDRTGTMSLMKLWELASSIWSRVKRAIGLPDDIGLTNVTSGSFAKAKVSFDMLAAAASDGQDWVSAMVNDQIIADILEFNYPDRPRTYRDPAWVPQEIEEKFSLERAKYWQTLVDMGTLPASAPIIAQDLGIPLDQLTETDAEEQLAAAISSALAKPEEHSTGFLRSIWKKLARK